jgi:hypothetical protein
MIAGLKPRDYSERLKELGLTTMEERRHQLDMVQVYKIVNEVGGVNSEQWFKMADNARETRRTDPTNIRIHATSSIYKDNSANFDCSKRSRFFLTNHCIWRTETQSFRFYCFISWELSEPKVYKKILDETQAKILQADRAKIWEIMADTKSAKVRFTSLCFQVENDFLSQFFNSFLYEKSFTEFTCHV